MKNITTSVSRFLTPCLVDVFLAAVLLSAFVRPGGWQSLLTDGDTGWHIRTGEIILQSGRVPTADPFSFSRPGDPWFAWEWLADILYAAAYAWRGMAGVAALAGVLLGLAAAALFVWLLRRGAGMWIAAGVTLAAFSASTVHHLARPHIFSIGLYTLSLWILDEDRRRPGWLVWLLPPVAMLWSNLHGGFVILPATLFMAAAVCLCTRRWNALQRYSALTFACAAATLANPYGWRLHQHIAKYLTSSWILNNVQEFQSPQIRSESMLVYSCLLLAGVALASRALARREWLEGTLVLIWAFASLRSARHIPLYAVAAAPVIASEAALLWRQLAAASPLASIRRVFWDLGQELARWRHVSIWPAVLAGFVVAATPNAGSITFPERQFPVRAVEKHHQLLVPPRVNWSAPGTGGQPRILTSDQWGDYLIFRLYPQVRVFFDGRSDFYGSALGDEYRELLMAGPNWRVLLDRHAFDLALLPQSWPLSRLLESEPGWNRVYSDSVAVLFRRTSPESRAAAGRRES